MKNPPQWSILHTRTPSAPTWVCRVNFLIFPFGWKSVHLCTYTPTQGAHVHNYASTRFQKEGGVRHYLCLHMHKHAPLNGVHMHKCAPPRGSLSLTEVRVWSL